MFQSIIDYKNSFRLINKLHLWRYFGVPIIISCLTSIGILILAWKYGSTIGGLTEKIWIWDYGETYFRGFATFFGRVFIVVLGMLIFRRVVMALSAPFMGSVAEKIEKHLYPDTYFPNQSGFFTLLFRGIRINLRNFILELIILAPLLLMSMIPLIGFITGFLIITVNAYYAGFGNMDYTLERHYSYRESIRFVRKHPEIAIGNGLIFLIILGIPILGVLFALPLAVTAATQSTLNHMQNKASRKTT